jgi:heat shock protein HslJ
MRGFSHAATARMYGTERRGRLAHRHEPSTTMQIAMPSRLIALAVFAALAAAGCQRAPSGQPAADASPPASPEAPTPPASSDAGSATPSAVYRARGNEPLWTIEIADGELRWSTADAPVPVVFGATEPVHEADRFTFSSAIVGTDTPARALAMSAEKALCRDSMSGMPFPQTVTVRVDDVEYRGCGGEPMALLTANEWTVASIGGNAVAAHAPTLTFSADGRVAGFAGCNRWGSEAALSGEGLSFGTAFATQMDCAEEGAMATEQAFLDALAKVTRHDFDAEGRLLLKAGDDPVLEATPSPPASPPTP